jgi:hypothetical protein
MKAEWRVFGGIALFLFVACGLYAWWSKTYFTPHQVEWVGVVALILSGLLCLMCGGYFWFVSRRIDARPEDRADAEITDAVGEVGFFSPGSYIPFGMGLAAITAAIAIAYWAIWLLVFGLAFTIIGAAALVFEYYTGARRGGAH